MDAEGVQPRLILERGRATRQLEVRFGVLLTGTGMIASPTAASVQVAANTLSTAAAHPPSSPANETPFIPSELQQSILEALDQKALTLDALVAKLSVDRSTLHRNGIKELSQRGLIHNNRRVGGYYRPDAPPPKYADLLGKKSN